MIKLYQAGALLTVLVRCRPVHTPMYGLPLSESDQRIRSVFQSVYNKKEYSISHLFWRHIFNIHKLGGLSILHTSP